MENEQEVELVTVVQDTVIKNPDGAAFRQINAGDTSQFEGTRYRVYKIPVNDWDYMHDQYGFHTDSEWDICLVGPSAETVIPNDAIN